MSKNVSVNTLTYNNKIVGYRLLVTDANNNAKYYDLNVGVAEKYGLAKGMSGIEVPLINYGGLLLSKQEKEQGVTVEDMSNNIAFLKEMSALKMNKRKPVDIKAKAEEDKRKAMQMDRFNRLLRVCLNVIANRPYLKKLGNYNVIALNLDNEIDAILVSQGVFTTDRSLNKRIKIELINYMKKVGYSYVDVVEYKKLNNKNQLVDSILSKCNVRDILLKDSR